MFWLIAAALAGVVVVVVTVRQRRLVSRVMVAHASMAKDEIGWDYRLTRHVSRRILPVRLVGVGGAARRLDTGLIHEQPDLDIGGRPARALTPLVGQTAYLLVHPVWIEIWVRDGPFSARRVVALERLRLHKDYEFMLNDPDGIGADDARYQHSIGTVRISVTERLYLFFNVLIKPRAPHLGPSSTNDRGVS